MMLLGVDESEIRSKVLGAAVLAERVAVLTDDPRAKQATRGLFSLFFDLMGQATGVYDQEAAAEENAGVGREGVER